MKPFSILVAVLMLVTGCASQCTQVSSLQELSNTWRRADSNTLVCFDVDDVLITVEDRIEAPYWHPTFQQLMEEAYAKSTTPEELDSVKQRLSPMIVMPKRVLVEESTPALIRDLQARGIPTIALTACRTGKYGIVPSVERWRIEGLRSQGIDFSLAYPEIPRTVFAQWESESPRGIPVFEEGCLCTGSVPKGEVLKAFLQKYDLHPTRIIFIDDKPENLVEVKAVIEPLGIEVIAVEYRGADPYLTEAEPEVARAAFEALMQEELVG